jgi:hypothetical protein
VAITVVVPTLPQTAVLINGQATFDVTLAAASMSVWSPALLPDTMDFYAASIG